MNNLARRNIDTLISPSLASPFGGLDQLLRGFFVRPFDLEGLGSLKVDICEDDDKYHIHADMPGVKKENIKVQIEGDVVSISAENKQENIVREGERVLHSERQFGHISRSFRLAREVDETSAKASFNDGVLELTLPKKPEGSAGTSLMIE